MVGIFLKKEHAWWWYGCLQSALTALPRVRSKIIPASEPTLASKQWEWGAALPSGGGDSQVQIKSPWVNFSRAALPRAAKLALMPSLEAPKSSRVLGLFPGLEAHAEIGPGSNCLSIWKPTLAG